MEGGSRLEKRAQAKRWPRLLAAAAFWCAADAGAQADSQVHCESVGLYDVCGDLRFRGDAAAAINKGVFDLGRAEALEVESRLRELAGGAARPELEARWNRHLRPFIEGLRLHGGVAFFDLAQKEFFALHYPPFAVAPVQSLRKLFRPSARFNEFGRLAFSPGPVARIDLHGPRRGMRIHWAALRRICAEMADVPDGVAPEDCARSLVNVVALPFRYPHAAITRRGQPDIGILPQVIKYYVWVWQYALYLSEFKQHALARPRSVFAFRSPRAASPMIDRFANLYLPERMLQPGSPDALGGEALDLLMLHEAAHAGLFGHDFARTAAALWLHDLGRLFGGDKMDEPEAQRALLAFLRFARDTDELLADQLALARLAGDPAARARYGALVRKFETVSPSRNRALAIVLEYLDAGGDSGRLMLAEAVAFFSLVSHRDRDSARAALSLGDRTREWNAAREIVDLRVRELQRGVADLAHAVKPGAEELRNPWALERQMQDFFRGAIEQLRSRHPK